MPGDGRGGAQFNAPSCLMHMRVFSPQKLAKSWSSLLNRRDLDYSYSPVELERWDTRACVQT